MPDLLVGYGDQDRGLIAVRRGNVEAVYPAPKAQPGAPFLPVARVFPTAVRADHLGTGDFDADSLRDIAADDPDSSTADGVRNTNDSAGDGPCTLRAAIDQANVIASNDGHGVRITSGTGHSVLGNSIHPNTGVNGARVPGVGLAIELG